MTLDVSARKALTSSETEQPALVVAYYFMIPSSIVSTDGKLDCYAVAQTVAHFMQGNGLSEQQQLVLAAEQLQIMVRENSPFLPTTVNVPQPTLHQCKAGDRLVDGEPFMFHHEKTKLIADAKAKFGPGACLVREDVRDYETGGVEVKFQLYHANAPETVVPYHWSDEFSSFRDLRDWFDKVAISFTDTPSVTTDASASPQ